MGEQSHLYEGSDPTRFATFCVTAEPVGRLWAVSASFLLLAGGIENLSGGFGQNYVLFSSKFTALASISRQDIPDRSRGPWRLMRTGGPVSTFSSRGQGKGAHELGSLSGCLPRRRRPSPCLPGRRWARQRSWPRGHSHLLQGTWSRGPSGGRDLSGLPGQRGWVSQGRAWHCPSPGEGLGAPARGRWPATSSGTCPTA